MVMSTVVLIAIIAAAVVLAIFLFVALRRWNEARAAARERRTQEAAGHRQQADAHTTKARELGSELEHHRAQAAQQQTEAERHRLEAARQEELAQEHAKAAEEAVARADEIEDRIPREGRGAAFHDERATELEEKL
jgi:FtsZ-interacting cell division protein ZipA